MVNLTVPKNVSLNVNANGELVGVSQNSTLNRVTPPLSTTGLLSLYAPLSSPVLTGVPSAPTPATSTNNDQIATTAFVKRIVSDNINLGAFHIDINPNPSTIPCRIDGGAVAVGAPTSGAHATTKTYVDNKINLGAFHIDINPNPSTIPCRINGGAVAVGTPTSDIHATTKLYVDTALGLKAPKDAPTFTGTVKVQSFVSDDCVVYTTSDGAIHSGKVIDAYIADDTITGDKINSAASIADTKLATISTAGKVSNSATSATTSNSANTIVLRDANGKADIISTTQDLADNSSKVATTEYVDRAVSNLVSSAPATLDTLNELATALGNDVNFSTTITTSLATKAPQSNPTLSGTVTLDAFSGNAGIVHNNASGVLSSYLLVDADIEDSTISYSKITNEFKNTIELKAPKDAPTFTGTVTLGGLSATAGIVHSNASKQLTSSLVVDADIEDSTISYSKITNEFKNMIELKAPKDAPTFTGTVTLGGLAATAGIVHSNASKQLTSSLIVDADIEDSTISYSKITNEFKNMIELKAPKDAPTFTGTVKVQSFVSDDCVVYTTSDGAIHSGKVIDAYIADDTITGDKINSAAAIADTKLATISTAGKVSNSATSATTSNSASTIVLRDANGKANIISTTQALADNSSKVATTEYVDRAVNNLGSSAATISTQLVTDLNTAIDNNANALPEYNIQNNPTTVYSWGDIGAMNISGNGQYILIGAGSVFAPRLSTDSGATFNEISGLTGLNNPEFALSYSGQYQVIITYSYVYLSSNYGSSWSITNNLVTAQYSGVAISSTGKYIMLAVGNSNTVYISSDFGVSWETVVPYVSSTLDGCCMSNNGKYMFVLARSSNGRILKSSDYGATWQTVSGTVGYDWNRISCSGSGQYLNAIIRGTSQGNSDLFISSNYGASFTVTENGDWYNCSVSNSGRIQLATQRSHTGNCLSFSNDFGANWTEVANTQTDHVAVAISEVGGYAYAVTWLNKLIKLPVITVNPTQYVSTTSVIPSNPTNGTVYFDLATTNLKIYFNGSWY